MKKMFLLIFEVLFLLIFCSVGLYLLWTGIDSLNQSMATKKWVPTPGILKDVQLVNKRGNKTATHTVNVAYEYQVKDVTYYGNSLSYGYGGSNDREGHSKIYEKLKSAKKVIVRFNPANHGQSTLSYGSDIGSFFMIGFGAFILVFVTLFAVVIFSFEHHFADLLRSLIVLE
jgi:Protein of unknown function (DUF3592)